MYDDYLIPANTKRGKLILGWFRPFDIALFGSGVLLTMVLLAFLPVGDLWITLFILSPALITGFLVLPVPYYHNIMNVIVEAFEFYTHDQTYKWKGWCYRDGSVKRKK